MKTIALIVMILLIAWTLLYLYFEWRMDKKHKEFQKRIDNFKIKADAKKRDTGIH
jgi:regulatory protein YycI of two-component signal transduction system YycFG